MMSLACYPHGPMVRLTYYRPRDISRGFTRRRSQQPVFAKLCEIESEIAGSLRPGIDHHVAHARLQWWREECERSAQGRPVHPLTRELVKAYGVLPAGDSPRLSREYRGFVDTAVWDLAGATFETRKELTAYCDRWAVGDV